MPATTHFNIPGVAAADCLFVSVLCLTNSSNALMLYDDAEWGWRDIKYRNLNDHVWVFVWRADKTYMVCCWHAQSQTR